MPYDYKKKTKCTQSSGETGHYLVKKKGSKKPKCYKNEKAFRNSQKYKYWAGIEEEEKKLKKESIEMDEREINLLENYIRKIIQSIISE